MPHSLGIVLRQRAYSDSYDIASLYTQEWGVQAMRVPKNQRRGRGKGLPLQMLTIVQIDCMRAPQQGFVYPQEIRICGGLTTQPLSPEKTALCFFMCELTEQIVRQAPADKGLFRYIAQSIELLDLLPTAQVANLHLAYYIGLLKQIGVFPDFSSIRPVQGLPFCLQTMTYTPTPCAQGFIDAQKTSYIASIAKMNYHNMHCYKLTQAQRHCILQHLTSFAKLHHTGVYRLESVSVLQELFAPPKET